MRKKLQLLSKPLLKPGLLTLLVAACTMGVNRVSAQSSTVATINFEDGTVGGFGTADASETDSVSVTNVRTGSYANKMFFKTASGNKYCFTNNAYLPLGASSTYVHGIYWAKLTSGDALGTTASLTFRSSTGSTTASTPPIATGAGGVNLTSVSGGTATTLSATSWTQVHYGVGATSGTNYYFPCVNRVPAIIDSIFVDDFVLYTSNSITDDILPPLTPSALSATSACSSVNLAWTSNTDDLSTGTTGVQNTFVLRTTVAGATAPILNPQVLYSVAGGTAGPNTVKDASNNVWTIVSTTTGGTAITYNDNPGVGTFKYAVVLEDYALNYSAATLSSTVTLSAPPTVAVSASQAVCNTATTAAVTFTPSAGATYIWTNDNTTTGLTLATNNANIPAFTATNTTNAQIRSVITVTPYLGVCAGTAVTDTIFVNPTPTVTVVPTSQSVCNAATTQPIGFSGLVTGTQFNWINNNTTIGLGGSFSGNIGAFAATNTTNAPVTATINVTPVAAGCSGTPQSTTITVNPTPTVTLSNTAQSVCNGLATQFPINFTSSGNVAGETYSWTTTNSTIGLGTATTANIPTFTAINTGNVPVVATITVTPSANGCPGTSQASVITVNPTPTVTLTPSSQSPCNGATTTAIGFTGVVANTVFNWVNSNTTIGYATASGTGTSIPAFTATNLTGAATSTQITVSPVANGCTGTSQSATITVNPSPVLTLTNQTQSRCNGAATAAITFSSVPAATYTWVNSATSIGLAAASTGTPTTIASFTAANTSTAAITANIVVTPTSTLGCVGPTQTATITVNPIPVVTVIPASATVCNATTGGALAFSSSVTGVTTTYAWTGSASGTGILTSGTASIAAFAAVNTGTAPIINNISVTPTAAGCIGLPVATTITVNPTPIATVTPSQAVCANTPTGVITFTSNITSGAPTTYAWANSNTNTNIAASGTTGPIASVTATNSGNTTIASTITVTPTSLGCVGAAQTTVVTVYPIPVVNVSPASQSVCNNQSTTPITFTSTVTGATTTYAWTNNTTGMGIAVSGTGNIGATNTINAGSTSIFDTITVIPTANTCPGVAKKAAITVNPTPTVTILTPAAPQVLCNGILTGLISFGGSAVAGTVYNWVNNTASINPSGPSNSSGNIAPFTVVNTGVVAVTGTITVTPAAAGCFGSPQSTSITVNPTPNVTPLPLAQALCSGSTTTVVTFTSNVANASYSWVSGNSVIGGPTGTTTGNVNPFQATNNTNAPITDTITVTPNANGCAGPTGKTTITVNPIPAVTATPASQAVCANTPTSVQFNSLVAGATYAWTNNTPSIGLAATGSGNISFLSANAGTTDVTATISVVSTANGCSGTPRTATVTVHPVPTVATVTQTQALCTGAFTTPVVFTGTVANTAFSWVNNNITTGIGVGGSGTIPSVQSTNTTNFPNISVVQVTPVANGCTGLPILVNITVNPYPPAVIAGSANTSSCSNDSVTLTANTAAGYSYQWKNNGAIIPNAQNNTYFAHVAGNYTVSITALGCTTTSNQVAVTIKFVPPAPIYNTGGSLSLCPGDSVTLGTANNVAGYTFQWQENGVDIPGATTANYSTKVADNFEVKVSYLGCTNTSVPMVTSLHSAPAPETIAAPDTAVCPGGFITLHVDSQNYVYQWYKNNNLVNGANQSNYNATTSGSYSVGITNNAGCTTFTNAQIVGTGQTPAPIIKLNGRLLCAEGGTVVQWYLNGSAINGATGSCVDPGIQAGGYTVAVVNNTGCQGNSAAYYFNTGVSNVAVTEVKLYPNPATTVVNVNASTDVNVAVSSMDGKQLIYAENATKVDISKLPNAVYLIKVYDRENNLVKIEKLVKTGW